MAIRASKAATAASRPSSFLDWERRMGFHLAFHMGTANNILHKTTIPWIVTGILQILRQISLPGVGWNAGQAYCAALGLGAYARAEPLLGLTFSALQYGIYLAITDYLPYEGWSGAGVGLGIFAVALAMQVGIGHHVLEPDGRDDAHINGEEFKRTKNPVPLVMVFYYHWCHLWFLMGYRPALWARISAVRSAQDAIVSKKLHPGREKA